MFRGGRGRGGKVPTFTARKSVQCPHPARKKISYSVTEDNPGGKKTPKVLKEPPLKPPKKVKKLTLAIKPAILTQRKNLRRKELT